MVVAVIVGNGTYLDGATYYKLTVIDGNVNNWQVTRRFNDFRELDKKIGIDGALSKLELPATGMFGIRRSLNLFNFNDNRKEGLQRYLTHLCKQLDTFSSSAVLQNFLQDERTGANAEHTVTPMRSQPASGSNSLTVHGFLEAAKDKIPTDLGKSGDSNDFETTWQAPEQDEPEPTRQLSGARRRVAARKASLKATADLADSARRAMAAVRTSSIEDEASEGSEASEASEDAAAMSQPTAACSSTHAAASPDTKQPAAGVLGESYKTPPSVSTQSAWMPTPRTSLRRPAPGEQKLAAEASAKTVGSASTTCSASDEKATADEAKRLEEKVRDTVAQAPQAPEDTPEDKEKALQAQEEEARLATEAEDRAQEEFDAEEERQKAAFFTKARAERVKALRAQEEEARSAREEANRAKEELDAIVREQEEKLKAEHEKEEREKAAREMEERKEAAREMEEWEKATREKGEREKAALQQEQREKTARQEDEATRRSSKGSVCSERSIQIRSNLDALPKHKLTGVLEQSVIGQAFFCLYDAFVTKKGVDVTEMPCKADGSAALLAGSNHFFKRLLAGGNGATFQSSLRSDIAAVSPDLRKLSLEQLLAIRIKTLEFPTDSDIDNAHSSFLTSADNHIYEKLARRLIQGPNVAINLIKMVAPQPLVALGYQVILRLGASKILNKSAIAPKSPWHPTSIASSAGTESEATVPVPDIWVIMLDKSDWDGCCMDGSCEVAFFHSGDLSIRLAPGDRPVLEDIVTDVNHVAVVEEVPSQSDPGSPKLRGNDRMLNWIVYVCLRSDDIVELARWTATRPQVTVASPTRSPEKRVTDRLAGAGFRVKSPRNASPRNA